MITKTGDGKIVLSCDLKGCAVKLETGLKEFRDGIDQAKQLGWKVKKISGEWKHFCRWTHESMNYRGQQAGGE